MGKSKPTRLTNSIRALRFASGEMTQAQLAERIGVTRQTVIAIEQEKYSPSLEGPSASPSSSDCRWKKCFNTCG